MAMLGSLSEPYIRLHEVARFLHWTTRKARTEFDSADGLIRVPAGNFAPWVFIPVPVVVSKLRSMNYPEADITAFVEVNQRNRNNPTVKPVTKKKPVKTRKPLQGLRKTATSQRSEPGQKIARRRAS
jgi:hypothetical protein